MLKVVDVVYHSHNDFKSTSEVIKKHAPSFGYVPFLKDRLDIELIKHFRSEATVEVDGVPVRFFKRSNRFWDIPLKTSHYIRSVKPDVVIVEGLVFPIQLIVLRLLLKKRCAIILQHHGEQPYRGYKKVFQRIADRYVDAYMFTSKGNFLEWVEQKVIKDEQKCFEVLEASTSFSLSNKQQSRRRLNMKAGVIFLWVGRLNQNKDPLTVLAAFEKYLPVNPGARLYLVYQTDELLPQLKGRLSKNRALNDAVTLVGRVEREDMETWYSAADFYISASHREGSGYALLEAMSCGCIPIVTHIPSYLKITKNGEMGFLYPPGDVEYLSFILQHLPLPDVDDLSGRVVRYFNENLSFNNIASDLFNLCVSVSSK